MIKRTALFVLLVMIFYNVGLWDYFFGTHAEGMLPFIPRRSIKVGILHSLSGTMSISERPVVDATLLAIEELNKHGGVLGRLIEPVVADGRSDPSVFLAEAERLITGEKVSVVFGCWTSLSRKTVRPVFEKHKHLLFYPVQYEGLEESPNIVYTGAAPNQQIIPAVKWCFDNLGRRFFLAGSDYVFPRSANAIIKDQVSALRGEIVGEEYVLLGSGDMGKMVEEIKRTQPSVILNTINGDTNIAFFRELRKAGITSDKIPTMSFSITENEVKAIGVGNTSGDYACWNYFQSVDTVENRIFVDGFKKKFGSHRVTCDPMEAAYFGVFLWAQAVEDAGTDNVKDVLRAVKDQSIDAPEGMVQVDSRNNHCWKIVRIGRIAESGQFDILWTSEKPVRPNPYPVYRPKAEWDRFSEALRMIWGKRWSNPGITKEIIEEKIDADKKMLVDLIDNPAIISAVEAANEDNAGLSHDEIARKDHVWRKNAPWSADLFSRYTENDAAGELIKFMRDHPDFVEIFVTDRSGLIVAMTNRTSDYVQSDEDWWKQAWAAGPGQVVTGHFEFDPSVGSWGVPISVPIYGRDKNRAGVIKVFRSIKDLIG